MQNPYDDCTAIILAGGLGRRFEGRNKGLISLAGTTLMEHVINRLKPQVQHMIINANQDLDRYQAMNFLVVADKYKNNQGPLAGILSCREHIKTSLVLTVPCDAPLLPENLLIRLLAGYQKNPSATLCVVHDGSRLQNLFMLFNVNRFNHLEAFFHQNNRQVGAWIRAQDYTTVDFSDQQTQFTNINTEETLNALLQQNFSLTKPNVTK